MRIRIAIALLIVFSFPSVIFSARIDDLEMRMDDAEALIYETRYISGEFGIALKSYMNIFDEYMVASEAEREELLSELSLLRTAILVLSATTILLVGFLIYNSVRIRRVHLKIMQSNMNAQLKNPNEPMNEEVTGGIPSDKNETENSTGKQRIKGLGMIALTIIFMIPLAVPFGLELLFLHKDWSVAFYIVGSLYLIYPVHSFLTGRPLVVLETIVGALPSWAIVNHYLTGFADTRFEFVALVVCLASTAGFLINNVVEGISILIFGQTSKIMKASE